MEDRPAVGTFNMNNTAALQREPVERVAVCGTTTREGDERRAGVDDHDVRQRRSSIPDIQPHRH